MKFTLLTATLLALGAVSCSKEKADTKTVEVEAEVKPSVVSGQLSEVVYQFDGEKYVPTQLDHSTDYFIVYNTASW